MAVGGGVDVTVVGGVEVGWGVGEGVGDLIGVEVGNLTAVVGVGLVVGLRLGMSVTLGIGAREFTETGLLRLAQAATAVISKEETINTTMMLPVWPDKVCFGAGSRVMNFVGPVVFSGSIDGLSLSSSISAYCTRGVKKFGVNGSYKAIR